MATSADLTLPKSVKPNFPDKCIVCHAKPDSKIKIAQNSQNWFLSFFLPILMLFGWSRIEIPICKRCKPRFIFQRWGRNILFFGLIMLAIWLIMPHFQDWSPLLRKVTVGVLVLFAIAPFAVADAFWPKVFDTTAQGDRVDYEFADPKYAMEFFVLNSSNVIAINGEQPEPEDAPTASDGGWHKNKSGWMEQFLGEEYGMVMHAMIPYAVGGALDLYYYPYHLPGTAIATKELCEAPGQGSSNKTFDTYELVMFTRHPLNNLDDAKDENTAFGKAHRNISAILNHIAPYSAQATLNPHETCEFPTEMERVGGKCLIFDAYRTSDLDKKHPFGMMLIIEIFSSEMQYARDNGGENLLTMLKQAGHYPYSDLERSAVA